MCGKQINKKISINYSEPYIGTCRDLGGQKLQYPPPPGWLKVFSTFFPLPTRLLCNTGALRDPRESVWWLVRLSMVFNERDGHTNSLLPFSQLGYMWSLSKVAPQHNVFHINL